MKIKFIKEYCTCFRDEENMINTETFKPDDTVSTSMEVDRYFTEKLARWLIDNGFAEKVEEGVEWLHDGVPYYQPEVSGLSRKFVPSYNEYCGDDVYDEAKRRIGICYKSREACQRFIDFLTAVEAVRHDEGFMKYNKTCCEVWELRRMYLDVNGRFTAHKVESEFLPHLGAFYFDTEEHAIASSKKHSNEWQTILNYDWSKGEDEEDED